MLSEIALEEGQRVLPESPEVLGRGVLVAAHGRRRARELLEAFGARRELDSVA